MANKMLTTCSLFTTIIAFAFALSVQKMPFIVYTDFSTNERATPSSNPGPTIPDDPCVQFDLVLLEPDKDSQRTAPYAVTATVTHLLNTAPLTLTTLLT